MTESWRNCNRSPLSGKENQDEQHCTLPKEWFGAKARGQMYKTVPHLSVNKGRNVYIDSFQNICSSSSTSAINWRNSEKGRKGELLYLMFLPLESGLNKHYWRKRLLCNSKGTRQGWKKRRSGQTTNVREKKHISTKKSLRATWRGAANPVLSVIAYSTQPEMKTETQVHKLLNVFIR